MPVVLAPVHAKDLPARKDFLEQSFNSINRVYVALQGPLATAAPTLNTLDCLVHCCEAAACANPQLDVIPLFPSLGWNEEAIADLEDIDTFAVAEQDVSVFFNFFAAVNAQRIKKQLPALDMKPVSAPCDHIEGQKQSKVGASLVKMTPSRLIIKSASNVDGRNSSQATMSPLEFDTVAVGGTFDRLHAGHRLLLAATALVARKSIFVGVTSDKLLSTKKNKELLQSYEVREAAAIDYMKKVNPRIDVVGGPLTDPNIPPLCATERNFDAIVVTEETIPGAEAINDVRKKLGFPPLVVVVVGLIGSQYAAAKLSSTELREREVAAAAAAAGQMPGEKEAGKD